MKELPIIIPLVIYHGQTKWKIPTNLSELINGYEALPKEVKEYVPDFKYLLYDISRYSDEDIKGSAEIKILFTLFCDIVTKTGEPLFHSIQRALYYWLE
ncbi:Rpn family recombination-promoting nuclease/putative transposase [Aliibacillus thermotolerans]|uniref:Rpn family recombination-promoting nuclease/putative transposase n=1 Tax=Aliibacillus thermotolerans TaxID=1834418 RepID=UPI0022EAD5CA|nr:Rpn family recombination-promoting nuclease/putative transposase [Aliibacillus thermotolerans]